MPETTTDIIMITKLIPEMVNLMVLEGINGLMPTVSRSSPPMTLDYLERMISSQTQVFVAFNGPHLVGMASLAVVYQPVGIVCHVEDVAVLPSMQGRGVGERLMRQLIKSLPEGWRQLDLTSKPERLPAHRLYEKLGFKLRETGNYRLKPEEA